MNHFMTDKDIIDIILPQTEIAKENKDFDFVWEKSNFMKLSVLRKSTSLIIEKNIQLFKILKYTDNLNTLLKVR